MRKVGIWTDLAGTIATGLSFKPERRSAFRRPVQENEIMKYRDLREFIAGLEADGKLKRIQHPVSPHLEMTEIADRVLRAEGPALLFENPIKPDGTRYDYPVLANLFGTPTRALGMGRTVCPSCAKSGRRWRI